MQTLNLKFDGHCPPHFTRPHIKISKFRDEPVIVEFSGKFFSATVRGHRVSCCSTLQTAIEQAATEAANIQINVTTIRNCQ